MNTSHVRPRAQIGRPIKSPNAPHLPVPAAQRGRARGRHEELALPAEDRMLLVLRVDKRMEWKDISWVMLGQEDVPDPRLPAVRLACVPP